MQRTKSELAQLDRRRARPRFPQFRRRSMCRTRGIATTRTGTDFVSFVGVSPMGSTTRCMSTPRTDWTAATLIEQVHLAAETQGYTVRPEDVWREEGRGDDPVQPDAPPTDN